MVPTPYDLPVRSHCDSYPTPSPHGDDPPTVRVSRCFPSDSITPPPSAERRLSPSVVMDSVRNDAGPLGAPLKVGDRILGFELVEELGQGAFARVFLAHQESLARRPVALKVTLRPTREAERLARLQHTHIVPVYSVHDAAPVQVICMPYLGRRTIADLVRVFRTDHASRGVANYKSSRTRPARTTATADSRSTAADAKSTGTGPRPVITAADGPPLIGDPAAVLQVLSQLAAGLEHAHERGILHLDLKPANVLLADTGEPMLLDFNLSFDASDPTRELVGGTVPYMSVEQLLDLRTRGKGAVDARSDLYSLGVMAFEMLTGSVPFPASFLADINGLIETRRLGPPSIRSLNPRVTPAVEAIVRKLLEPEPSDRYQSASQLREDVDRHLKDQPLRFAREKSVRERVRKWYRRNPKLPGRVLAASFFCLALGCALVASARSEANARTQAAAQANRTRAGLDSLRLDLVVPGDAASRTRGIDRANSLLAAYGVSAETNWEQNDVVRKLTERDRLEFGKDLGEMLLLLALARWQDVASRPEAERAETAGELLKLTAAARGCFPADSAPGLLDRLSAAFHNSRGEEADPPRPASSAPMGARELFLDAADHVAAGRYKTAIDSLEKAIEDQPNHAAAQFCLAYCRQQLGQYQRALERYEATRVLILDDPRPMFQRGVIFTMIGEQKEAEAEYSRVLALDPSNGLAYRNRGLMRMRLSKFVESEEDYARALECGGPAMQVHLLRAELRRSRGDKAGADADRQAASNLTPKREGDFLVRGVTRIATDPNGALADFQAAAAINPRSIPAIQNQAHVLEARLNQLNNALTMISKGVEMFPEYAPMRTGRAVLLARAGLRIEAHQEIQRALDLSLSEDPDLSYRAACVYALTSITAPEDQKEAIFMLKRAVRKGFRDIALLNRDTDLDPIRKSVEFQEIAKALASLRQ